MKKIDAMNMLEKFPLFTQNEFVRMAGLSPEYARTYLYRLEKEGRLFRVERGKYTVSDDPLAFSSCLVTPSYISFWTALRLYDFTEQLPLDVMVATSRQKRRVLFHGTRISFFKTKQMWGYKKHRYGNFDIFLAEKEKCIIDSLLLKNVPFDEIVKALKTKDFDSDKLVEYAIRTKNKSLAKRLGYLMERVGLSTGRLTIHLDSNYIPLGWPAAGKKAGGKNKKWKVIENYDID